MKMRFVISVVVLMSCLFFVDRFLAGMEHSEVVAEAQSMYARGEQLLDAGQAAAAIDALKRAHSLAPESHVYELAFARALLADGQLNDAGATLEHLLQTDSNDGAANLTMARLQAGLGRNGEAEAYYHRALYGTWPAGKQLTGVRLELAEFLASHAEQKQLLSELLLLQDSGGLNSGIEKTLAHLFLVAGSPARAADTYRSLIRQDPDDLVAYVGLAETQLASGDYHAAKGNFRSALHRKPDDNQIEARLQLATELNDLDPTPRRLSTAEKFGRSELIVEMAQSDAEQCTQVGPAAVKIQSLMAELKEKRKSRRQVTNEAAESLLTIAEQLWHARVECGAPAAAVNDPLPLLMRKIAQ